LELALPLDSTAASGAMLSLTLASDLASTGSGALSSCSLKREKYPIAEMEELA
jgi:hypothetical protein